MSHKISQNLKGILGEKSVKKELSEFSLFTHSDILDSIEEPDRNSEEGKKLDYYYYKNGKYYEPSVLYKNEKWQGYCFKKIKEKFGTFTLPDFWVKETKFLIEVKTGKGAKLEKNQIEEFPKILKKGFRIFIIKTKLIIEKRKFEVAYFYCTEFLGKYRRIKINLDEIKQLIRKEVENMFCIK